MTTPRAFLHRRALRRVTANGGTVAIDQAATKETRRRRDGRNTKAWRTTRLAALKRDGYTCRLHHPGCTTRATTVHRLAGGYHDTDLTAYISACRHCHGTEHGGTR